MPSFFYEKILDLRTKKGAVAKPENSAIDHYFIV
jgi:hypothetical protein